MKYQVIKQLKTKSKQVALFSTLDEAKNYLNNINARFESLSYYGGFPFYSVDKKQTYSIQGLADGFNIVCSLSQRDIESFGV